MNKLIITDLDGTFLNEKGSFDKDRFQTVKKSLDEKGIFFAICTGKQCERVEELFEDCLQDIWILGDSATRIKRNGKFLYESFIPNKIGQEVIRELIKIDKKQTIIACTANGAVVLTTEKDEIKQIVRRSYQKVLEVDNFEQVPDDFVKITVLDLAENTFDTLPLIAHFSSKLYMVASEKIWIDIANFGVHKGTTVQKLQEMLNVTKEKTVAFGDGLNDLEMFEQATVTYAMENAVDEIKEKATFLAPKNTENGVLQVIEEELI